MINLTGQNIKGYDVEERIGTGGFGSVYRAKQTTVAREVAIKVILPHYASQPDFIRRFETEAQLVARLEHLHIVPLYDYWRDPSGAYLVMRWMRGGSLRDVLRQGTFELEPAALLLDQLASALNRAHRSDIIHRDIKPANILLDEDENAYIGDFGIAKDIAQLEGVTEPDATVGSPDYLAPEQARHESVTPATDIYSLGVTLYEMLAGEHPFPDLSPIERMYKHLNDPLPELTNLTPDISDAVNTVIGKATAKNPEHRYSDALEFASSFREAAGLDRTRTGSSVVEKLTRREHDILALLIEDLSNKEIASRLFITVSTVRWYLRQIYSKLGVRSRVQAIVRARELNLVTSHDVAAQDDGLTQAISMSLEEIESPYKGLAAFHAADNQDFFGREKITTRLVEKMSGQDDYNRFLAVIGPSGSGKSSLVSAGLIPALWRGDLPGSEKWYVIEMTPGAYPLDELEIALIRIAADQGANLHDQLTRDNRGLLRAAQLILPDDGSELVLVIDQFEELFTHTEDEALRKQFLDLLHTAVVDQRSRVRIVITLRADFYDRPLQYPEFGDIIRKRVETILPLNAAELERAIVKPAERVGVQFEEGLVAQIMRDVHYEPGSLPLLQFALTELFEMRDNHTLTIDAYQDIGGAIGALANRADELYQSLGEEAQAFTRQMFLRLVTLGEGVEDTRRRVPRSELLAVADDPDLADEVIDAYTAYRFLALDHDPATREPTVEVAHEALLREWEQLRRWLNDSRESIRMQRRLDRLARDWDTANRDPSFLLRGARLASYERWMAETDLLLTDRERTFLEESLEQQDEEQAAEIARLAREADLERRSRTILRTLVAVLSVGLVVTGLLAAFALSSRAAVRRSADEFRSLALISAAQRELATGSPDTALAFATEAMRMDSPPPSSELAFPHIVNATWIQHRFLVSDESAFDAAFLPDGERVVTTGWGDRGIIEIRDLVSGEVLQSLERGGVGRPTFIAVHPDGNLIGIAGFDPFSQMWNLETDEVTTIDGGALAFSDDGTRLITDTRRGGGIRIWDTETWEVNVSFDAYNDSFLRTADFSADGSLLVTGTGDGIVKIWDPETGELLQELDHREMAGERGPVIWAAQFLSDQTHLLVAGHHGIALWNWQTAELIWHQDPGPVVQDLAISPDERLFVVGYNDPYTVAELRTLESGRLIRVYHGHSQRVQQVGYSPDGTRVISASIDGSVIVWPVNWEGALNTVFVNSNNVIISHPSQSLVATVGIASPTIFDTTIRLVDTNTGQVTQEFPGHSASVRSLAFTPDERYLVSGDTDGWGKVWDLETGELAMDLTNVNSGQLQDVAITPDSQIAAFTIWGGPESIRLWNIDTGEKIRDLFHHEQEALAVAFSPDGKHLYSAARDGSVIKSNWQTQEVIMEFDGHEDGVETLAVSADGSRLITGSFDRTARVWDTNTGELIFTLEGHGDSIMDVEFSPDDQHILTASGDGTAILWDAATGDRLRTFVASNEAFLMHATFSADGTNIITAANDVVTVWEVSPLGESLLSWASENRYIPPIPCEQRELFQIEPLCNPEEAAE